MITHNLPVETTPFVGRKQDLSDIVNRLWDQNCRLLTIVGPGGIGKTRLALHICRVIAESANTQYKPFIDGVYFVPLQSLISTEFKLSTLCDSLGIEFSPNADPEEDLLRFLRPKSSLLVLDNFEHLLNGVGIISRLIDEVPRLKILTTSREALNLHQEWLYTLDGLRYPVYAQETQQAEYDALNLFASCAQRIHPRFSLPSSYDHVAKICRLVEGMPLALELAASWVRYLSVREIAHEIELGLDILETRSINIPDRHRNMRAMLDTSWNRLSEDEQVVFRKLSIFRGGFTREAAHAVTGASRHVLAGLVDKSWLKHASTERYDIHELLRQYGEDQLNSNTTEAEQTHDQHCHYFAHFLTEQWHILQGANQITGLAQLEMEIDNIRTYWDWAIHHQHSGLVPSVFNTLWRFYDQGNRFQEGEQAFGKAATIMKQSLNDCLRGQLLARQGSLRHSVGKADEAKLILLESLSILERFDVPVDLGFCLIELGRVVLQHDDDDLRARNYLHAGLQYCEAIGNVWGKGMALFWIGISYSYEENLDMAWHFYQKSLAIQTELRNIWGLAEVTAQLSAIARLKQSYLQSSKLAIQSLHYFQELGVVWGIAMANRYAGSALIQLGQFKEAQDHIIRALTIEMEYNLVRHALDSLIAVGRLWAKQDKIEQAVELMGLVIVTKPYDFVDRVKRFLAELKPQLDPTVFDAALERGKTRDFEATVRDCILELQNQAQLTKPLLQDPLTEREVEVLRLVADGYSNRAIAQQLVLAVGTVKWYVSDIFSKLGVSSRTQAIARARELNILSR